MTERYDLYVNPSPSAKNSPEDGFPMTTSEDYIFGTYKQPPFSIAPGTNPNQTVTTIDPNASDLEVNRSIINAAALEERKKPHIEILEIHDALPCTYDIVEFIDDTEAAYATDLLCTAWLELYNSQVETGDYPVIKEDRTQHNKQRPPRIVPRRHAGELPNGTRSETVEIYLTPERYIEYRQAGLIPDTSGGQNGIPRVYWFEHDGDGYKAGTNADTIYRTNNMKPLSAANIRGTYNSVTLALTKIPTLLSAPEQDAKDRRDATVADAEQKRQLGHRLSYSRYPSW